MSLYSLFRKRDGRWRRLSILQLPKERAIRYWQDTLLASLGHNVELRRVKNPTETIDCGACHQERLLLAKDAGWQNQPPRSSVGP